MAPFSNGDPSIGEGRAGLLALLSVKAFCKRLLPPSSQGPGSSLLWFQPSGQNLVLILEPDRCQEPAERCAASKGYGFVWATLSKNLFCLWNVVVFCRAGCKHGIAM